MGPLMTKNFHTEAKIFLPGAIGPLPKGVTHTRRTVLGFVRRLRMYILCPRTYILNFRMYILNFRMEREEAVFFPCSVFGLHYLYGCHHEGSLRLGNKNN